MVSLLRAHATRNTTIMDMGVSEVSERGPPPLTRLRAASLVQCAQIPDQEGHQGAEHIGCTAVRRFMYYDVEPYTTLHHTAVSKAYYMFIDRRHTTHTQETGGPARTRHPVSQLISPSAVSRLNMCNARARARRLALDIYMRLSPNR